jgi:hypothetical protein
MGEYENAVFIDDGGVRVHTFNEWATTPNEQRSLITSWTQTAKITKKQLD